MMKSLKIRLELNNKQESYARQHSGVARHAWNWALDLCKKKLENKEKLPSAIDLHKLLVKDVKSVNNWYYDVSKCSPQQSLRDLRVAIDRSFKKTSKFPRFKKKGKKDSFYLEGVIQAQDDRIKVPKFGWLKCSEILPQCDIKNVVISRTADDWFIAFKVPFTPTVTPKQHDTVGVDLGVKTLATLSTGETVENPRPYKTAKRKLRLAQRQMSKKFVKGAKKQSNNYKKAAKKVAKIHQKVANIRKDSIHKLTTYLAKNHSEIVIEDLNVRGMSKNHKLASSILDGGFFEFRRQITYKSEWYGAKVTVVNRFFPSSKTCSSCGEIKATLKLSERIFKCGACGYQADRDLNAAYNLEKKAVSYTVSACGVSNTQIPPSNRRDADTVKQEANSNLVQDCVSFV
jgi:putative transposase